MIENLIFNKEEIIQEVMSDIKRMEELKVEEEEKI